VDFRQVFAIEMPSVSLDHLPRFVALIPSVSQTASIGKLRLEMSVRL